MRVVIEGLRGEAMIELFKGLLDLVFPPTCRVCGRVSKEVLCSDCMGGFPKIDGSICLKCGKPCQRDVDGCRECSHKTLYFSRARSGGMYKGPLKEAIHQLKYKNGKGLSPYLARFISDAAGSLMSAVDATTYVPLSSYKESLRGYNQSRLIAQEISHLFSKPLLSDLVKTHTIPEQNKLGLADRPHNIKGAFAVKNPMSGRLLLIDDVYTTGSTVNECARVLLEAGAEEVFVLTVARTPLEGR